MTKKIRVNVIAEKFVGEANGVYTAIIQLINNLKQHPEIEVTENGSVSKSEVTHSHTIGLEYIWKSFFNKKKMIVSAHVVTIVGDQAGTKGTPKNKRKRGQEKLFLPSFAQNYYSLFTTNGSKPDDRFEGRTERMTTILRAAEGFWIPSEICKKYVYYSWI